MSVWFNKFHINFDYKNTFNNDEKVKDEKKLSLFYPVNKFFNFKFSSEFEQKENILALEYRF